MARRLWRITLQVIFLWNIISSPAVAEPDGLKMSDSVQINGGATQAGDLPMPESGALIGITMIALAIVARRSKHHD